MVARIASEAIICTRAIRNCTRAIICAIEHIALLLLEREVSADMIQTERLLARNINLSRIETNLWRRVDKVARTVDKSSSQDIVSTSLFSFRCEPSQGNQLMGDFSRFYIVYTQNLSDVLVLDKALLVQNRF